MFDFISNQANTLIAFATIIYTVATILLWRATISSIRLTKELFTFANSPFIGVDSIKLYTSQNNNQNGSIKMNIRNFGNTIGTNISIKTIFKLDNETLQIEPTMEFTILPPNHSNELSLEMPGKDFSRISRNAAFTAIIETFYNALDNKKKATHWEYKFIGNTNFECVKAYLK